MATANFTIDYGLTVGSSEVISSSGKVVANRSIDIDI